eukprot:Amastigsp_a339631_140.p3 type:complete len:172 gc:universal Amastigsp_a339631_140:541-26(-)
MAADAACICGSESETSSAFSTNSLESTDSSFESFDHDIESAPPLPTPALALLVSIALAAAAGAAFGAAGALALLVPFGAWSLGSSRGGDCAFLPRRTASPFLASSFLVSFSFLATMRATPSPPAAKPFGSFAKSGDDAAESFFAFLAGGAADELPAPLSASRLRFAAPDIV